MVHLFVFLLLNANNEDGEWRGVKVKRGQIITGLNSLNEKTKISIQTLRTCLSRLEKTGEINTQVTNQYRLITICHYDAYQSSQQATNKQPNKQLTSDQQATNSKQEEEERKEYIYSAFYNSEIAKCKNDIYYIAFVKFLYGENDNERPLTKLLNMNDQIKYERFKKLLEISTSRGIKIKDVCLDMDNYSKKTYTSFNRTLTKWLLK